MSSEEKCGSNSSAHAVGSGNAATRVFVVDWASRLTFAQSLTGAAHPEIPYCWCNSLKIDPIIREQPANESPTGYALVTAEYATDWATANHWPSDIPKPDHCEGTGLTLRMQYAGDFLRVPAREMQWDDNPYSEPDKPIPDDESMAGRILIQGAQYDLQWVYVDDPPIKRLRAAESHVNEDEFLGCDPGTLLFLGFDLTPSANFDLLDPGSWELSLKFMERRIEIGEDIYGWNHELRADGWQQVNMRRNGDSGPRYQPMAFAGLLACAEEEGGEDPPEEPPA